jgi:transcriptional antiterminator NusG
VKEAYRNSWFAIQVRSRHEASVGRLLQQIGHDGFVPTYPSLRQWSDRKVLIDLPLFEGYVFCKFRPEVPFSILAVPGVIRIVGSSRTPLPISQEEIEAVRTVIKFALKAKPHPYPTVGSRVRIREGPLAGIEGIVDQHLNNLVLSVRLVHKAISVQIDPTTIQLVRCQESCE